MESNTRWQKVDRGTLESEKLSRPSLTYWQDCWQRLKKNKSAILSLIIIVVIVLAAIFVPMFWRLSYDQQNLEFANIPPQLELYDLGGGTYVYLTNEFKCIDTDEKGNLIASSKMVKDDKTNRMYIYEINGKPLVVDYGVYFKAKSEFIRQEAANASGGQIAVADVNYLAEYFGDNPPESGYVTIDEARTILDKKIERFTVTYDGTAVRPFKTVSNKTYIWGSDSLGRDMFIRVIYGARMSLLVGVVAAIVNFVIGVLYGGIAGFCGGSVDNVMMRIVDTISSIPMMLYVILIMVVTYVLGRYGAHSALPGAEHEGAGICAGGNAAWRALAQNTYPPPYTERHGTHNGFNNHADSERNVYGSVLELYRTRRIQAQGFVGRACQRCAAGIVYQSLSAFLSGAG